tara:strand:- start:854 stop:1102 length:249 start_codon:yes stop_codon:yes gene_type:complete
LGVPLSKLEVWKIMPLLTEGHSGRVEIKTGVACGPHGAREPRGTTSVTAADFEDFLVCEVDLARDMVVELDADPMGLVRRIE